MISQVGTAEDRGKKQQNMKYHTSMLANRTTPPSADEDSVQTCGPGRRRKRRRAVEVIDVSEVETSGSRGSICIDPAVFSDADYYARKSGGDAKTQTHVQDACVAIRRNVEYICCAEHRMLPTDTPQQPSTADTNESDADGILSKELPFGSDATNFKTSENLTEHVTNTSVRTLPCDKPSTTFQATAYTPTEETYSLASAEVVGSVLNEDVRMSGSETFRNLQKIAGQDGLNANILKTLIEQGEKELNKRGRFR
ncbi:hypothetical protein BJ741DRAFT_599412 [Chytriomyces cf. hyalinus JEL632]|nr:hypothetical protein BJ741DRAFT_599412 [Chytriomyces cf. hyalinus JEL632]